MLSLFRRLQKEKLPAYVKEGDVYNTAVMLSLEWGENWGNPIQSRLRNYFPNISAAESNRLDDHCRELMSFSVNLAEKYYFQHEYSLEEALSILKQQFPKLEARNLSRLLSQAVWYARK